MNRKQIWFLNNTAFLWLFLIVPGALSAFPRSAAPNRCSVSLDPFTGKGEFSFTPSANGTVSVTLPAESSLKSAAFLIKGRTGNPDYTEITDLKAPLTAENLLRSQSLKVRFILKKESYLFNKTDLHFRDQWHPVPSSFCRYELNVLLPAGFTVVSESESESVRDAGDGTEDHRLIFPHPLDSLTLTASSEYTTETVRMTSVSGKKIRLRILMFPEDKDLHSLYLKKTQYYIEMYENLFGEFPYRSFTVAASSFPAGYSLPGYTLIGRRILRYPFVYDNSLGHEVLHQWFGNGVHVNYGEGNWSEGITTYFSDHYYKYLQGNDAAYRKNMLLVYQKQIAENPDKDFPVTEFRSNEGGIHQSVGYGKTAAVLHNLRQQLGPDVFLKAVNSFLKENMYRRAGWSQLQKAFEKASGKDLTVFFNYWLKEKGLTELPAVTAEVKGKILPSGSEFYETEISLVTEPDFRKTGSIPFRITGPSGESKTIFINNKKKKTITSFYPAEIIMDPNYDIPRFPDRSENPFTLNRFLEGKSWILYHEGGDHENPGIYSQLADFLKGTGAAETDVRIRNTEDPDYTELRSHNIILTGRHNRLRLPLYGSVRIPDSGSYVSVYRSPWNSSLTVTHIWSENEEEIRHFLRVLPRYGNYSEIVYKSGRPVLTELRDSAMGSQVKLYGNPDHEPLIISPPVTPETDPALSFASQKLRNAEILYLGEQHNLMSHHLSQVSWIKEWMRLKNISPENASKRTAIALEMFPVSSQPALDDFISGRTDEREFIKKSLYFYHWGFDYELYRPLFLFARENRIPLIALNAPRDLVRETGRNGIHGLAPYKQDQLPFQMDFSSESYREFLADVFSQHMGSASGRLFENFVQAQILWDESMADTLYRFTQKHPGTSVAVIAGNGHLRFYRGIPERMFRRSHLPFAVLLHDDDKVPGISDFITETDKEISSGALKLGVHLKEHPDGITVTKTEPESAAQKAGIMEGDLLRSVNGVNVFTAAELRTELVFHDRSKPAKIKVWRRGKEVILKVQF